MNRKLEELRQTLLKPINPAIIVVLGLYTVVWGLWIALPWFSVFGHSAVYSVMSAYGSEYLWGGIAVASGLIIIRGSLKPIFWNIEIGSLVAFFFWLTISIFFFAGNWQSTAWLSSAAFALYSGIIWLNIKVNRKYFGHYDH